MEIIDEMEISSSFTEMVNGMMILMYVCSDAFLHVTGDLARYLGGTCAKGLPKARNTCVGSEILALDDEALVSYSDSVYSNASRAPIETILMRKVRVRRECI